MCVSERGKENLDPRHRLLSTIIALPVGISTSSVTIAANTPANPLCVVQITHAGSGVIEVGHGGGKGCLSFEPGTF